MSRIAKMLYFRDLVLLRVIAETADETMGVVHSRMTELGNAWLKKYKIPIYYSRPFGNSMSQHETTVATLMACGLVDRVGNRRGYRATDAAFQLFEDLGVNWRKWPVAVRIEGGDTLDMLSATYAALYRKDL